MPTLTLPVPREFSFAECLRYLGRSARESLHVVTDGTVSKVIAFSGQPVVVRVSSCSSKTIQVDYTADRADQVLASFVQAYVTDWFDLATDLQPFYSLAQQDALLASAVERHYGLRVIGIPDLFEALCWAIIGQQINLAFAYTLKQRMVQTFGTVHFVEERPYYQFPLPEVMVQQTPASLTTLQFPARKAEYILGIARAMVDRTLSQEALSLLSEEDAEETLMRYKGVGSWTARYVLLKCLKQPDAFPAKDVGLHNALKQGLGLSQKPDIADVYRYAEPWRGWRGYATFYLWQTLLP